MTYHHVDGLFQTLNKSTRRARELRERLEGGDFKTLIANVGSPLKDPKRIRTEGIQPNPNGVFEVQSASRQGTRLWKTHNERLFPIKGKGDCHDDFVALEGPDLLAVADSHDPTKTSPQDHFRSLVDMSRRVKRRLFTTAPVATPPTNVPVVALFPGATPS